MYSVFYIWINLALSICTYFITSNIIPKISGMFIKAGIYGVDMNKKNGGKVPEALGVVTGCVFLIFMFLFIPIPFSRSFINNEEFPHNKFVEMIAALLSICCMLLLGFADDVLDLRWRHKLLLPTVASLPLLIVYYVNFNSTTVIVPGPFRQWFGYSVNLGVLYYVYMGMLAVFCTNAINIFAGINGLEVGQSVIIASSIAIFNLIELAGESYEAHLFSIQFILPYIATSLALLKFNWYPSRVFVGDTFCYFSGMTFAVLGILGHFSKTMLLFFIPQIFNFIYSLPQLFRLVPCPRHRMPKLNAESDKLEPSRTSFKTEELLPGVLPALTVLHWMGLVHLETDPRDKGNMHVNNLTLINVTLIRAGPQHEAHLTAYLMLIQVVCSCVAFAIRYPLASLFYDT